MAIWVRDPHAGGAPISDALKRETSRRLMAHAQRLYASNDVRLDLRFRGSFCYIDVCDDAAGQGQKRGTMHLCRLRYCGQDQWSVAFFAYSNERYEPCAFASGSFFGTPEEGFDLGAVYLPRPEPASPRRRGPAARVGPAMHSVPKSRIGWLREIAAAYNDAREAVPFGPLVGAEVREADLFHLAPSVCAKFRGVSGSKRSLKKATDTALISYIATSAQEPAVFAKPCLAFAFCYLAAHVGLDILSEDVAASVMDFVVEHEAEFTRLLSAGANERRQ